MLDACSLHQIAATKQELAGSEASAVKSMQKQQRCCSSGFCFCKGSNLPEKGLIICTAAGEGAGGTRAPRHGKNSICRPSNLDSGLTVDRNDLLVRMGSGDTV